MSKSLTEKEWVRPSYLLLGGVLTSAVSSVCCIGPFFFLATGISGAWMSGIMMLKSYYPIFAVTSLACIFTGGWLIMRRKGTDKLAPNLPVFLSHDSIKNVSAPSIPT